MSSAYRKCKLILLLVSLLTSLTLYAQKIDLRFENISSQDGLSSDWARWIIQDRLGFLWIATDVGLDRFDGYSFLRYRADPNDPGSISQERITLIRETSQGNLWLYSGNGIDIFDPYKGKMLRHIAKDQFGSGIWGWDAIRNNEMWIGAWPAKLLRFDGASGRLLPLPEPLRNVNGYIVLEDNNGDLWIATQTGAQNGLVRYTPSSGRLRRYPACAGGIYVMAHDKKGNIWFACKSSLDFFDREAGSFHHYPYSNKPGAQLIGGGRPKMVIDRQDRPWIGSESGLRLFDRRTQEFLEVKPPRNARGAPIINTIYGICADANGNAWIGSFSDGFFKYNERFNRFRFIGYNPDPDAGLIDPHAVSVMEDRQGIIWITTWGGVLTRYDPGRGVFSHYQGVPSNPSDHLPKRLYSPLEDSSGNLWLGSTVGLVRFDRNSGRFHRVALRPEQPGAETIAPGITTTIHEEGPDRLVFSTTAQGLFHVNTTRNTYTFEAHRGLFPKNDKSFGECPGTFPDRSGMLWVCTNNGLHCRDPRSGRVRNFLPDPARKGALVGDWVYHVFEDSAGTMWVATRLALNRMDRIHGTFKAYTEQDGLRGHVVYRILEDDDGFIWVSTNEGISRFDPRKEEFRNFGPSDGVTIGRGWSACRSREGKLLFTGTNGIVIFDPREVVKTNTHVPPVFFTALHAGDRDVPLHQVFSQRDQSKETGRVTLLPGDRMLSVEFAALDFSAPEKNQYAFRLEEQGNAWNDLGTQHRLTLTGLGAGTHTLRVKGSNNDGVWNETGVVLQIEVLPTFWQTWWFKVLCLLLLAGIVLAIIAVCRTISSLRKIAKPPNLDEIFNKYKISHREQEILHLVIQGKSNREMENELFISIPTVKRHLANIYEKIGVSSRLQLINFLQGRKPRY